MDKHVIALVLAEIGTLLDMLGENQFRARAFHTAARALDALEGDVVALARSGELAHVRGFGPATAQIARELVNTGESRMHRELRERTPSGLFELLAVPGLGARRIHTLHTELGVQNLEDLRAAAESGRIAELRGFGKKTAEKILAGIDFVRGASGRWRQPQAFDTAGRIVGFLELHPAVREVKLAGELRRRMETVDGVDVVAASDAPAAVLDAFQSLPGIVANELPGGRATGRLADGFEVRLRCVRPASFVAACVHETGNAAHWNALVERAAERGLKLSDDGLRRGRARVELADEAALYAALELPFIPPELREGVGEIEAAESGALPELVRYEDLRGTFHCHTTYSDGTAGVAEMAEAALARGWRYLGISDHSQAASYAGGLTVADIVRQHAEIDAWNASRGGELWLFKGIEADILRDGRLDYDADTLERFDFVIGSVHGRFRQTAEEMTARILGAIEDPRITFVGHLTGRLLLTRDAYELDVARVVDTAVARGVAIELNADPARLDMDWRYFREFRGKGLLTAINPDAHSGRGLGAVEYGIGMARKGWVTAESVVNCWSLEKVREFFGKR